MREVQENGKIEKWMDACRIREHFDTPDLEFRAVRYERGEMVLSPGSMLEDIMFLVEGTIYIYGIRDDGMMLPITSISRIALLGDVEFCEGKSSPLCVEARTEAVFLVLSVKRYRTQLNSDLAFLHLLLHSLAEKMNMFALMESASSNIEERLLIYMRHYCVEGKLKGVEAAAIHLRCSRRQLQRVLRKLVEEGTIKKTGKGSYKLTAGIELLQYFSDSCS